MAVRILQRIKRNYGRVKIQTKILIAFYLVVFSAGLIGGGVFYYNNYQATMEEDIEAYQRMADTVRRDVEYLQQDVKDIATYFAVNSQVHQILISDPDDYQGNTLFWQSEIPVSFIQDILAVKTQIKTLILYPENGLSPFYVSRDSSVHQTSVGEIQNTEIYQKAREARGDIVWIRMNARKNEIYENTSNDKIVAAKMLFNMSKSQILGLVVIGMNVSQYTDICETVRLFPQEGVLITDSQGNELVSVGNIPEQVQKESILADYVSDGYEKYDGYYIFRSEGTERDFQVYYFSPENIWQDKTLRVLNMPLAMLVIILICVWPFSYLLSNVLSRPLARLCVSMDRFRSGDFQERAEVRGEDEIGQLARSFNKMVEDIQRLIDQNYVLALREKESELNILQAQINPHFLYNVLDSLYWRAIDMGNEEMGEDILALSKLFRLVLNQGNDEITVEKEIELVQCYLHIQKMRMEDRLTYEINMAPEILKCRISKLLIQPFVENAVVHGLEDSDVGGFVKVRGYQEGDFLVFIIQDNGVGMQQDEADRILEDADRDRMGDRISHYAISNIQERLRLCYQEQYQLEITSGKNKGTQVRLVIPIKKRG